MNSPDISRARAELMEEDKALGLIDAPLPSDCQDPEGGDFYIWRELLPSVRLFIQCMTQWRYGPAGPVGLDYAVALQLMGLYCVEDRAAVFEDFQVMEERAIEILNEKREG